MKKFVVKGEFEVPLKSVDTANRQGKEIDKNQLDSFWNTVDSEVNISGSKGVYIFANRIGRGYKPVYVGMTNKSFKEECFKPHKINKLQSFFDNSKKTVLVLFFIAKEGARSAQDDKEIIADMESYFIHQAYLANSALLNDRKKDPKWAVKDVSGERTPGQPSLFVQNLKQCLNMD